MLEDLVTLHENDMVKVKMLSAIVIRQDNRIKSLEDEIFQMKRAAKRSNLSISGIDATSQGDKTDIQMVQEFFSQQMQIQEVISVEKAYWSGSEEKKQLNIKLSNPADKATIFSNVSKLKGKTNAKRKLFFVNDDQLESEREQRKYYQHLVKENESRLEDDKLAIKLKKGSLYVNNDRVKSKVKSPTVQDVLTLNSDEMEDIHQVKLHAITPHEEGGSEFFAYMQRITSEGDVQKGLAKMKIKFGDADHITSVYRLEDAIGPYKQGFVEDSENGAGWRMLETLKDQEVSKVAVHVARYQDRTKLGPRHFVIYKDLVKKAVKVMKQKLARLERANRLRRSVSQSSQLSVDSQSAQDPDSADDGRLKKLHTWRSVRSEG